MVYSYCFIESYKNEINPIHIVHVNIMNFKQIFVQLLFID